MNELIYVYGTAVPIVGYFLACGLSRRIDPFAPIWLFLVGYMQVYVVQPISYHDWAVSVRGPALVAAANWRALWALAWLLLVYQFGPARAVVAALPSPPRAWSPTFVAVLSPLLVAWSGRMGRRTVLVSGLLLIAAGAAV